MSTFRVAVFSADPPVPLWTNQVEADDEHGALVAAVDQHTADLAAAAELAAAAAAAAIVEDRAEAPA